jgi:alcohol dehydrogenase (cytochrome c)
VFWGTGNPAPPFDGSKRSGDNLFSNSLLALDADSGKLKWYFQFTPHDVWDWDSCHVPVLFDDLWQGHKRKLVAIANKNAYFYVLDRQTGRFHSATPFAPQSWTAGLDNNGRPRIVHEAIPTNQWTSVEPSFVGATNWYSPSYSPQTGYFYVLVREVGGIVKKIGSEFVPGQAYWGGAAGLQTGGTSLTAIRAMNTQTGQKQWEFRLHSTSSSGLLSTASGLVFGGGTDGNFFALDAENGKPLWNFQTGGEINGNPVSYAINGRQFVVTAAGNCLITFGL